MKMKIYQGHRQVLDQPIQTLSAKVLPNHPDTTVLIQLS